MAEENSILEAILGKNDELLLDDEFMDEGYEDDCAEMHGGGLNEENAPIEKEIGSGLTEPAVSDSGRRKPGKPGRKSKKNNQKSFVQKACVWLREPKVDLLTNAVRVLGLETIKGLLQEVAVIEKCGGQMTIDNKRRRSPGGVLWNIIKCRVKPEVFKSIMNTEREVQRKKDRVRQKRQSKAEKTERDFSQIDEPFKKPAGPLNAVPDPSPGDTQLLAELDMPKKLSNIVQSQKAWLKATEDESGLDPDYLRADVEDAGAREQERMSEQGRTEKKSEEVVKRSVFDRIRGGLTYEDVDEKVSL